MKKIDFNDENWEEEPIKKKSWWKLFKNIFLEVLHVDNNRSVERHSMLGSHYLYPENTRRDVKKLTLRGYKYITQSAKISFVVSADGVIHYNEWKKINI